MCQILAFDTIVLYGHHLCRRMFFGNNRPLYKFILEEAEDTSEGKYDCLDEELISDSL